MNLGGNMITDIVQGDGEPGQFQIHNCSELCKKISTNISHIAFCQYSIVALFAMQELSQVGPQKKSGWQMTYSLSACAGFAGLRKARFPKGRSSAQQQQQLQ